VVLLAPRESAREATINCIQQPPQRLSVPRQQNLVSGGLARHCRRAQRGGNINIISTPLFSGCGGKILQKAAAFAKIRSFLQ